MEPRPHPASPPPQWSGDPRSGGRLPWDGLERRSTGRLLLDRHRHDPRQPLSSRGATRSPVRDGRRSARVTTLQVHRACPTSSRSLLVPAGVRGSSASGVASVGGPRARPRPHAPRPRVCHGLRRSVAPADSPACPPARLGRRCRCHRARPIAPHRMSSSSSAGSGRSRSYSCAGYSATPAAQNY